MDIQKPDYLRARNIRRVIYSVVAVLLSGGLTAAVFHLRPAAPTVDKATIWFDEVKRGPMVRNVRGPGLLVPEDIRWIPAQTDSSVDRILLRPGAAVAPDSVILELRNPSLQRDALDAQYQLKASQAEYENLKAQLNSELLNQKAAAAGVRSEYEQAKIQSEVDEKLRAEKLGSDVTARLSKVRTEQWWIRLQVEEERAGDTVLAARARLTAQQSHVDQQRALYNLRTSELESLHVRAGIHGVLQQVPVEVGQHVTPGMNLARVADPNKLKGEIKIAETQAQDVAVGQKAAIDTRNGIVAGRVSRIDPAVRNGTVTVDVAIDDPLPLGARPDLNVDGTIELENLPDILYVSRPVHGQSNSSVGLFKLLEDGREAVHVNVKLGKTSVNTVEILQGLNVGDRVILSDMSQWDSFARIRLK
jgi:HlyD family secretion protein